MRQLNSQNKPLLFAHLSLQQNPLLIFVLMIPQTRRCNK